MEREKDTLLILVRHGTSVLHEMCCTIKELLGIFFFFLESYNGTIDKFSIYLLRKKKNETNYIHYFKVIINFFSPLQFKLFKRCVIVWFDIFILFIFSL